MAQSEPRRPTYPALLHQIHPKLSHNSNRKPHAALRNMMYYTNLEFKFFVVIPSKTEIIWDWFVDHTSYAFDDPLLEHALQAVTLIHLGKASKDQNNLRNGRKCYGNVLNELQAAARRAQTDAKMLAVCNIMCLYELYDSTTALTSTLSY
ncbi:hypothetical protein ACEPPN_000453 [Leptodophora sp. 'Broadleaf-Isolate-01']